MGWTKNNRPTGLGNPTGNGKTMRHMLAEDGKSLIDDTIWDIYGDIQEQLPYCQIDYIIDKYLNGGEDPSDTSNLLYTDTTAGDKLSAAETQELLNKAKAGEKAMKNIYKTKNGNITINNSTNGNTDTTDKKTDVNTNAEASVNNKGDKE